MEGIIILIVLIIIFNLFNFLSRALKGDRSDHKRKVLVEEEDSVVDNFDQPGYDWEDDKKSHDPFLDVRQSPDHYKQREEAFPDDEAVLTPAKEVKKKTAKKKSASPNLSSNLRQLLTEKDPLLTAFVFHEIIDPPRVRRRRF